ncbi:MAG: DUF1360 domain-containing protein [Anaerolineae bacterium]
MNPLAQKRLTYATLSGVFVLGVGIFALLHSTVSLTPLLVAELGFAIYRMGRMVSYDKVMETYRLPFVRTIPDPTGTGDTTQARGAGWREALGDLVCCPVCVGTWIAGLMVVGLSVLPDLFTVFVHIFCIVGIAELLNGATEYLQWNGQMAREYAGTAAQAKKEAQMEAEAMIPTALANSMMKTKQPHN